MDLSIEFKILARTAQKLSSSIKSKHINKLYPLNIRPEFKLLFFIIEELNK